MKRSLLLHLVVAALLAGGLAFSGEIGHAQDVQVLRQEIHPLQQEVVDQLNDATATLEREGYTQVNQYIDPDGLGETQSHRWSVALEPGMEHVITAVCDPECGNLDLVLYENGVPIDEDTEQGAYPTLVGVPGEHTYDLEIIMHQCDRPPCSYGYTIFRKD
ncbi:MAG: hypothetical protein VKK04_14660 [Synechococcales bacterium]|nr:hypothetical protein [Synechococcales bacterium]